MESQNAHKARKSTKSSIFSFFTRSNFSENSTGQIIRRNSTAFSDGAEPPDCSKLDAVEQEFLQHERIRILFCSNPEIGHLSRSSSDSQKKREILNTKINSIFKTTSDLGPSPRARKKLTAQLKRYKRRSIREVDSYAFDSLQKLFNHKGDNVIVSWHLTGEEPIELSDLQLSRPASFVKGGQGFVYAVHAKSQRKEFALKMKLREAKSRTAWLIEQREHQVLRSVHHEFIVTLYHYYCTREAIFLLMEFLDGGCLWSHVAHNGLMPEDASVYYAACILEAIDYLHNHSIVYRDMKAENIVLDWNRRPKLIDFGMSKFLRGYEPADMKPIVAPTNYYFAGYLAPEIYTHPEAADHRVDLWGIGYLVSEIHLGFGVFRQMPWDKLPRKHLGPKWELSIPSDVEVSPSCEGFLQSLMRQNPNKRPPIHSIRKLPFFAKIDWRTLCFQRGPNLKEIKFIPVRNTKSQVPSENHNSHCCHPHPSDPVENSQQLHESCLTKFDGIPCEKEKTIQPCICPPLSSEEFRHVTESEEQTFISNWTELH